MSPAVLGGMAVLAWIVITEIVICDSHYGLKPLTTQSL